MKKLLILMLAFQAFALAAQKNQLKIGVGVGSVPYESTLGWNAEVQYEYHITPQFSGFLSLGSTGDNFTHRGQ